MDKIIDMAKYEELPLYLVNLIEAVLLLEEVNIARASRGKSIISFKSGKISNDYVLPINIRDVELAKENKRQCNAIAYKIRKRLGFYNKTT